MKPSDIEELLAVDRNTRLAQFSHEAGTYRVLEAPDVKYTASIVRQRLGERPAVRTRADFGLSEWLALAASFSAFCVMLRSTLAEGRFALLGLFALPIVVMPMMSLLLYKGAKTDDR